jgi:hypothetical protein
MDSVFGMIDLLLGDNMNQISSMADNLPNAIIFEGNYVPMRRVESNFLEFTAYMSMFKITAVDENTITLNAGNFGTATYQQVEPYLFRIISSDSMYMNIGFGTLRFEMRDGMSMQVHVGNGSDLSPLPSNRKMPMLIGGIGIALCNIIFFFIAPVVLVIQSIKRRKYDKPIKKQFNLYQLFLTLCGTALVFNNVIAVMRFIMWQFRSYSEMMPHMILNYVLVLAGAVFLILSILSIITGNISKRRKIIFGASTALFVSFCILLMDWNFFMLNL